ncbi:hypothetical protein CC85DRAFT_286207 [Cutaneotrichosporon oleaginosum]|uniref:F-box domain-containing protein n=1 Tax=Cutaneotrichosporon oleaginosum TaxID=879819 RepID=A0A0J0XKS8_9TREE|nr:uncharacterized protein CC85DRAFT_286207 [Cutaneotrichosporon oleaginosum]KLT41672.1 hypothetical protein CC85DRAFT_286207 [Cutaneotrichosporon oleaginosum]TXT08044.1 hypothetical protein COLE_04968 [Cutaneotrichosporon oleaginosum]
MPSSTAVTSKTRKKWSLASLCIGEVPEEHAARLYPPARILETKPYSPPIPITKTLSPVTPKIPVRCRTIRFADPLPVPRTTMGKPHLAVLTRIAFFCDSQNLRKLRRVNREMRGIAESILLRHVAVQRGGVRVLPPPGGTRCWAALVEDASLLDPTKPKPKEKAPLAVQAAAESSAEGAASIWLPRRQSQEDDEDEDAPWPDSDTDAESEAESVCSNEPSSYSSAVAAACTGIHLPPAANVTFILPGRSRLLRRCRVVDIYPEADAAILRRMLSAPPPITRAYPGASGTLNSDTVVVFSRAGVGLPPAFPRPPLTTSAARNVITHLLDADGTESLQGLSCGTENTVVIISPAAPEDKTEDLADAADEEAEVATLVDRNRSLSPAIAAPPSPEQAARRPSLLEEDGDPHRLLESLAAHIARLLPKSGSAWTIVGAESWPADCADDGSERKCGPEDVRDMKDALRSLVSRKFAQWADKSSGDRLRFVSRAQWAREVGSEMYTLASEL